MAVSPWCAGARRARGWWVVGVLAVIVCSFTSPVSARTWVVRPGGSIQGAIDRAGDGDVVLVLPGEYRETINLSGAITVRSLHGPESVIVIVPAGSAAMRVAGSPESVPRIVGITFRPEGGASAAIRVLVVQAANFEDCRFEGFAVLNQAAVAVNNARAISFDRCSFTDCFTGLQIAGEGVRIVRCTFSACEFAVRNMGSCQISTGLEVRDCAFRDCAEGVIATTACELQVTGCVFERCGAKGSTISAPGELEVDDCIFRECGGNFGNILLANGGTALTVRGCLFEGGHGRAINSSADQTLIEDTIVRSHAVSQRRMEMIVATASATMRRCEVRNNDRATISLSGVSGDKMIQSCTFEDNGVLYLGASGDSFDLSAILVASNEQVQLVSVAREVNIEGSTMRDNSVLDVTVTGSVDTRMSHCAVIRNYIHRFGATFDMEFCTFTGNSGNQLNLPRGELVNCLFVGNHLGFRVDSLVGCTFAVNPGSDATAYSGVRGCIMRGSGPLTCRFTSYSNIDSVQSDPGDINNINADPFFMRDPAPGADGVWGTVDDDYGDLRLAAGSPCIDAGESTAFGEEVAVDLAGLPRFVDDPGTVDTGVADPARLRAVVDMGAFEFQGESTAPGPVCDVDGDEDVDVHDLLVFIAAWTGGEDGADVNGDGVVDVADLLEFVDCFVMAR